MATPLVRSGEEGICGPEGPRSEVWRTGKYSIKSALATLLVTLVLVGCGKENLRVGDFTPYFLESVREYGGRLARTNGLPRIQASWKVQKDSNGFDCFVFGTNILELDSLVTQALGVQNEPLRRGDNGSLYREVSASSAGVALIVMQTRNGVQVNCLKGVTSWSDFATSNKAKSGKIKK